MKIDIPYPLTSRHIHLPKSIPDTFSGRHLLVTGTTGFLGKVWLAMVLDRLPEVERITLLARGKKGLSPRDRFEEDYRSSPVFRPLRERLGMRLHDLMARKVRVIEASLDQPWCGLGEDRARRLAKDVDVVVHFAGLTDFEPDPTHAIEANIDGSSYIADLAACTPQRRLVHVSTTYVAGAVSGEIEETITPGVSPHGVAFDPAEELASLKAALHGTDTKKQRTSIAMQRARDLGWPNIYTYTKGLAEHLIESRNDVRTTTVRPAIVECARSYPFIGWNEGINTAGPIVWLLSTSFQRFPSKAKNHFDVVPVDTVARAMILVVARALCDRAKSVYHVASSHANPFFFGRAVELTGLAYRTRYAQSDRAYERHVLRRLDATTVNADAPQVFGHRRLRHFVRTARDVLRNMDIADALPPRMYTRVGDQLEETRRSLSNKCRQTERKLSQVDEMLRQYRPFIHDYDYVFRTDHLQQANQELTEADRRNFAFDVESIDWLDYWMNVEVPGLETWSIPLLRGEKVPRDEPLAKPPRVFTPLASTPMGA